MFVYYEQYTMNVPSLPRTTEPPQLDWLPWRNPFCKGAGLSARAAQVGPRQATSHAHARVVRLQRPFIRQSALLRHLWMKRDTAAHD